MAKVNSALQSSLFPILSAAPEPGKGIARLAAQSLPADLGHLVEFRSLKVRSILNECSSKRMMFAKTINPYRGCEFGCRYCYARYTHEFMDMNNPEDFERIIFIKQNAAWLLRQELSKIRSDEEIAIGTATDPYQPIERRAQVTRSLLEVLAEQSGLCIGLVTKSTLIERDLELWKEIARFNEVTLHLTITTTDAELARLLEPRAPRPDLRFQTVRRLREAGLRTGILCSPLLPGITDTWSSLNEMAKQAKQADASFFYSQPLFLKSCSKDLFLDFVKKHFPQLTSSYEARFGKDAFVSKAYRQRIASMVKAVCSEHGLNQRRYETQLSQAPPLEDSRSETQNCLWVE